MAWKKIAFDAEVASLSDNTPVLISDATGAAGSNAGVARDDHRHALGPLNATLNCNQNQMNGMQLEKVATGPDNGSEAEGQMWYNNHASSQHCFIWVP